MSRFIEGEDRSQPLLRDLDDYIAEDNPVRAVDAFVEELDLSNWALLGLIRRRRAAGVPPGGAAQALSLRVSEPRRSSRRLEREAQRNVELMWLTGRLAPDFKTIADFRRDNGEGIRDVCRRFVQLCRDLKLTPAIVAIDSGKFKAVNSRDGTSPRQGRQAPGTDRRSIQRYLSALETADRTQRAEVKPRPSGCARRSAPCASRCGAWRRFVRN